MIFNVDSVEDFVIENNVLIGAGKESDYEHVNLGKIILDTFNKKLDHVAQIEVETGKQTTFAEMKDRSIRCALWLKKQGIGSGDIVTLCTHNHVDTYVIQRACARRLMKLFRPKTIFSCESMIDVLVEAANLENVDMRIIVFGEHSGLPSLNNIIDEQCNENVLSFYPQEIQNRKQAALIILSSGSTGFPKGTSETGEITGASMKCKCIDTVGFVVPHTQIKIIDIKTNKILGANQPGELLIKSSSLMLGYYENLEATKDAIDNDGWFHSGDKGYYNDDGEVFIVDRVKEVLKYQNHQVSPTEIEEVLLDHPDVLEAAVVPIRHEVDGERPMAFVKKVPGAKVTEEELVQLSASLGELKKLRGGVKFLDELPKTITMKVSKLQLKEMAKLLVQSETT